MEKYILTILCKNFLLILEENKYYVMNNSMIEIKFGGKMIGVNSKWFEKI